MEQFFKWNILNQSSVTNDYIECLDYFYDYKFHEDDHSYYYKGEKVTKSVTGIVSEYVKPFNEARRLPRKAKERGIGELELKAEWQLKADNAS